MVGTMVAWRVDFEAASSADQRVGLMAASSDHREVDEMAQKTVGRREPKRVVLKASLMDSQKEKYLVAKSDLRWVGTKVSTTVGLPVGRKEYPLEIHLVDL